MGKRCGRKPLPAEHVSVCSVLEPRLFLVPNYGYLRRMIEAVAGCGKSIIRTRVCCITHRKQILLPCREQLWWVTGKETLERLVKARKAAKSVCIGG